MLASAIPTKFPLPFAANAATGYKRPIPEASQIGVQAGAASLNDGFPPVTFLPVGAGGTPPWGEDFNGLLNQITAWTQWLNAGAQVGYDAAFSTAIGGYPQGAIIAAAIFGSFWMSTVDNNTTDPDTGGAGWIGFSPAGSARIISASGVFTTNVGDYSIGMARSSSPASSSTTLPSTAPVAKEYWFEDLIGNFNSYPVTISAPAGHNIAGEGTIVLNVNRQCARFKFYGSNTWSVLI